MPTVAELDFYKCTSTTLRQLARDIATIREAVEKCTGRPLPDTQGEQANGEHSTVVPSGVLSVTKVSVFPFKEGAMLGCVVGMAEVTLNDQIVVRGLRVMNGSNGLFVGYPADPFYKGEDLRSVCFPVTRQLREHIENCVLEKYKESIK